MTLLRARWLGRLPYDEAWDLQRAFHEGRVEGRTADDYLLLLEHPPVFTVGRFGDQANLLTGPGRPGRHRRRGAGCGPGRGHHLPRTRASWSATRSAISGPGLPSSDHVDAMERAIVLALADLGIAGPPGAGADRGLDRSGQDRRHRGAGPRGG